MLDCGRGLNRSSTVAGSGLRSCAFVAIGLSLTQDSGIITEVSLLKIIFKRELNRDMRFPTMWYVRPEKAQTSLRIRAV